MFAKALSSAIFLIAVSIVQAAPALLSTMPLPAEPSVGRASSDRKILAVLLQGATGQTAGLQIIDTSAIQRPALRGFFGLPGLGQLELSPDGKHALIAVVPEKKPYNQDSPHEIIWLDLANLDQPKELWRSKVMARNVVLAAGAKSFVYSRQVGKAERQWEMVVEFTDGKPSITIQGEEGWYDSMAISPSARFLAHTGYGNQLRIWDLTSGAPKQFSQEYSFFTRYHCLPVVTDSGYVAIQDTRISRLGIYQAVPRIPRVSYVPHEQGNNCTTLIPNTPGFGFLFDDLKGGLKRFALRNPHEPKQDGAWQLPQNISALTTTRDVLFAGKREPNAELRIYRLDLDQPAAIDWQSLEKAHQALMASYHANSKSGDPLPAMKAMDGFEQAGILDALDVPPTGLSPRKAAALFNDYGFVATRWYQPDRAERALRRAIALDPKRMVAYLNLADLLRKQLSDTKLSGDSREKRQWEIEQLYQTYLDLGGKRTSSIASFLKGDLLPKESNDVCAAIAAYANENRLDELVSGFGMAVPFGNRKLDLVFTTEGTAHVPSLYAFDSSSDFPLEANEQPAAPHSETLWGGDQLGLLTYRNRHFILHFRDHRHPVAVRSINEGHRCQFMVATQERIGPKVAAPELCELLRKAKPFPGLKFGGKSPMSRSEVMQRWGESEIDGVRPLDFTNDGRARHVAQLSMSSSAGAGCEEIFYETVDAKAKEFEDGSARDLLMQLQGADPRNRYPVHCGNHPRFFVYKDRTYFETKPSTWPPIDARDQYHRVATIENGEVREVCDFRFESTVGVKTGP